MSAAPIALTTRQLADRIARAVVRADSLDAAAGAVLDELAATGHWFCRVDTDADGATVDTPLPASRPASSPRDPATLDADRRDRTVTRTEKAQAAEMIHTYALRGIQMEIADTKAKLSELLHAADTIQNRQRTAPANGNGTAARASATVDLVAGPDSTPARRKPGRPRRQVATDDAPRTRRRRRPKFSAAARRAISEAQKARWSKQKKAKPAAADAN